MPGNVMEGTNARSIAAKSRPEREITPQKPKFPVENRYGMAQGSQKAEGFITDKPARPLDGPAVSCRQQPKSLYWPITEPSTKTPPNRFPPGPSALPKHP